MANKIIYFGYGANVSAQMINALLGRVPESFPARLDGYGLFIQDWNDIPNPAKRELSVWDKGFRSYIAVPLKGSAIFGRAWFLAEMERAIIGEWELHNKWYKPISVKINDNMGHVFDAQTEIILPYGNLKKQMPVIVRNYPFFLNSKEKMLRIARQVRTSFERTAFN